MSMSDRVAKILAWIFGILLLVFLFTVLVGGILGLWHLMFGWP